MKKQLPPGRWLSIVQAVTHLLKTLEQRALPSFCHELPPDALSDQLFRLEKQGRERVDQLAAHLIEFRKIPTGVSREEILLLLLRLRCAVELLEMMFPAPFHGSPFGEIPSDWSHQQTLEWLLVDLWQRRMAQRIPVEALTSAGVLPPHKVSLADMDIFQK